MSDKERVRKYTEEKIMDCIDEIDREGFYFNAAFEVMLGALGAAELARAVTHFEVFEIRKSIIDSRLRYLENKGGEALGI